MGAVHSTYHHFKHSMYGEHGHIGQSVPSKTRIKRSDKVSAKKENEEENDDRDIPLKDDSRLHIRRSALSSSLLIENPVPDTKELKKADPILEFSELTESKSEDNLEDFKEASETYDDSVDYKESTSNFSFAKQEIVSHSIKNLRIKNSNLSTTEHENLNLEVVAIYTYIARTEEELSFNEGDKLEILEGMEKDWWKAKLLSTPYTVGYIPHTYVAQPNTLEAQPWYFFKTSRLEAERFLLCSRNEHAAFLIRSCKNPNANYALSVRDDNKVRHYLVHGNETEGFYFTSKAKFPSVMKLIEHHQAHRCKHFSRLGLPCIKLEVPPTNGLSYDLIDLWELDRRKLILKQQLGFGNFGEVYEGLWNGKTKVAVKTLKQGGTQISDFLKEAENMKQLIHPKVVQLYGVCTTNDPYYIVTELMSNGDLLTYLLKGKGRLLEVGTLIDIGVQVASGMAFLESRKFVHRDLAARNVLVGEENVCKVADFGLARLTQGDMYVAARKNVKLPVKWTAPESLKFKEFTTKSDVWSFGIVLVEIIEKGMTPYPAMNNTEVYSRVSSGYRMPQAQMPNCPDKLYNIMLKCWDVKPSLRPTFANLQYQLENFYFSEDVDPVSNVGEAASDVE